MITTANTAVLRTWLAFTNARDRLTSEERGEVTSSVVWVAGFVLVAILVVGILYSKLSDAANNINVEPGVGGGGAPAGGGEAG